MSGRFSATICIPLAETGRVELAVDIPDLGALSGEARSLVFALLGQCVEFAADVYAPKPAPIAWPQPQVSWTGGSVGITSSAGVQHPEPITVVPDQAPEPPPVIACPVHPCSFEAKGETGLRIHLSTTHKLRGESQTAVAERNRLADVAMGRTPTERPPLEEPPAIDVPVTRRADAPTNGTARIVTVPAPPPVVAVPPPADPVEWPSEPLAKVPFDPDVARRRAAEAL